MTPITKLVVLAPAQKPPPMPVLKVIGAPQSTSPGSTVTPVVGDATGATTSAADGSVVVLEPANDMISYRICVPSGENV